MKKFLAVFLSLTLAVSITACGATSPAGQAAPETAPAQDGPEPPQALIQNSPLPTPDSGKDSQAITGDDGIQAAYPVTVTDQLGRQVVIEEEPQTLVSGYYISTSLLLALSCQDKLAGIEAKAKSRPIYRLSAPSIIGLPNVGSAKEFDLEGCAALNPDLVILPARLKDSIPTLEELGIPVIAVNPENQELLREAALLLGTAANRRTAADALSKFAQSHLEALEEALAGTLSPSVYLAGNSSFLSTAGANMYQNTLIGQAGGTNAASELTEDYWTEISYEQLLAWDPEYIIAASDASYSIDSILNDPSLSECRAVKNGHVYQLPNAIESWDSPVPGSFLGSLWLASLLHPDQYPESRWKEAAAEFYETFYRFSPDLEALYEPN